MFKMLKQKGTSLPINRSFLNLCFGQLISIFGTTMSQFALGIWVFQNTGQASTYATLNAVYFGVMILLGPISGILVDHWNRKLVLIISDLMAGILTICMLSLFLLNKMEIPYLFLITGINGAFSSFQWLAFSTTIPLIVDARNLTRSNSALSIVQSSATIVAPVSAAALLPILKIQGILIIDISTCIIAVVGLLLVVIPRGQDRKKSGKYPGDLVSGWKYLKDKKELILLQFYLSVFNYFQGLIQGVLFPMILIYTGSNEHIVGQIGSAFGLGALVGGIIMGIWGGPKVLIKGVLTGLLLGQLGGLFFVVSDSLASYWILGAFITTFSSPLASNCIQSIWQLKVETNMQGRVFGIRRLISGTATPLGMISGGVLADYVFEPIMQSNEMLQSILGRFVGTSPGSGMALMILLSVIVGCFVTASGFFSKSLMNVEMEQ